MNIYVAAPWDTDLSLVSAVLTEFGADHTISTSTSLVTELGEGRRPDGVLAIFRAAPVGAQEELVFLELGIAIGRLIPWFVVGEDSAPELYVLPNDSSLLMRGALSSREALRFHLRLFLERLRAGYVEMPPSRRTSPGLYHASKFVEEEVARFYAARGEARGPVLERLVLQIFVESGAEVVAPDRGDRGFDFVVSMPGLEHLGGPVLIEVKSTISPVQLQRAQTRLASVTVAERGGLGIVVFDDDLVDAPPSRDSAGRVVLLGVSALLDGLRHASLSTLIMSRRNLMVHARGA